MLLAKGRGRMGITTSEKRTSMPPFTRRIARASCASVAVFTSYPRSSKPLTAMSSASGSSSTTSAVSCPLAARIGARSNVVSARRVHLENGPEPPRPWRSAQKGSRASDGRGPERSGFEPPTKGL